MDVVGLVEAPDQVTAEMWCELLKNDGIDAFPKLSSASGYGEILLGPLSPTGCWVMVQEEDFDRAAAVLAPVMGDKPRRRKRR